MVDMFPNTKSATEERPHYVPMFVYIHTIYMNVDITSAVKVTATLPSWMIRSI